MLSKLKGKEASGDFVQVGLVGAGSMGRGIAQQIGSTPGLRLSFIADCNLEAATAAARLYGRNTQVTSDGLAALQDPSILCDVLVEATNSIVAAYDYCLQAIDRNAHCVLMNAEVDLFLGHLLRHHGREQGVIVTSDGGDQHGVLSKLLEEIQMWGLDIVQVGNMKGFLDRHQTHRGILEIAERLQLSTEQCLAYTDGSKLNIEMAIIANEHGLLTPVPGMRGPRAEKVEDVLRLFDFDGAEAQHPHVDYILGARQHGGGVYVVARCDDPTKARYLDYYKVPSANSHYLFLRPYHLCHFETPHAIAKACLYGEAICEMRKGRLTDCYAYAKRDLAAGDVIHHAIGSDEVYGMIMNSRDADYNGHIPQALLGIEGSKERPILTRSVAMDQPLTWEDVRMPDSRLRELWGLQLRMLQEASQFLDHSGGTL